MFYMTFIEESDSKHKFELSVFPNNEGKVVIEMKGDDDDPYQYASITLTRDDVEMLVKDINRILTDYEIQ